MNTSAKPPPGATTRLPHVIPWSPAPGTALGPRQSPATHLNRANWEPLRYGSKPVAQLQALLTSATHVFAGPWVLAGAMQCPGSRGTLGCRVQTPVGPVSSTQGRPWPQPARTAPPRAQAPRENPRLILQSHLSVTLAAVAELEMKSDHRQVDSFLMACNKIKPNVLTVRKPGSPGSSPSPAAKPCVPPAPVRSQQWQRPRPHPALPQHGAHLTHVQPVGQGPCGRAGESQAEQQRRGLRVVSRSLPFPKNDSEVQPQTSKLLLAPQLENRPPPHNI